MANDSNTGIVAMFSILMIVLIGGLIAWRVGVFGGGGGDRDIDVDVKTPAIETK